MCAHGCVYVCICVCIWVCVVWVGVGVYVWVCDDATVVCFVGILCELNAGDVFGGER